MTEVDSESSLDPLSRTSTPPSAHVISRQRNMTPSAIRMSVPRSTPAKSFIMETGPGREASPWRIKVTVEAEPKQDDSPTKKRSRTRTVAVKGLDSENAVENLAASGETAIEGDEIVVRRPQRKRKGTPVRRAKRLQRSEPDAVTVNDQQDLLPTANSPPQTRSSSYLVQTGENVSSRRSTTRTKRLSHAREELDQALRDAVGSSNGRTGRDMSIYEAQSDEAGDLTVANEDFTMITGESLASIKANTSILSVIPEGEKSMVDVSRLPSSPPRVQYPDVSALAVEARTPKPNVDYDVMSWKPTMPAKVLSPPQSTPLELVRSASSPAKINEPADVAFDDIWAEEASRSLEEDQDLHEAQTTRSEGNVDDFLPIFSDDPIPPRRSKIPRTWRRSSGMELSYADSPGPEPMADEAHDNVELEAEVEVESRRSSGVLTPPSTDDEARKAEITGDSLAEPQCEDESELAQTNIDATQYVEEDSELTQPDAAATQLQNLPSQDPVASPSTQSDLASPLSDSSSDVTSPEGEDTGMFWQSNMPHIYQHPTARPRPQRRQQIDMSEILKLESSITTEQRSSSINSRVDRTEEPDEKLHGARESLRAALSDRRVKKFSPLRMRPVEGTLKAVPSDRHSSLVISSPLRKSLLRSSKMYESSAPPARTLQQRTTSKITVMKGQDEVDDSLASKASDQRQLLGEMASASRSIKRDIRPQEDVGHQEQSPIVISETSSDVSNEEEVEQTSVDEQEEPSQSYEENLNLESPQKIKVNFNDSFSRNSDLLAPRRQYAPLFEVDPRLPSGRSQSSKYQTSADITNSPPMRTLVGKRGASPPENEEANKGIFNRLSTSFWSAVVRPSGPNYILPPEQPPPMSPVKPAELYFPGSLRAQLRSRYGVMPNQHPWTMAHMRTLHRLLNSLTSRKSDSIVPTHLRLPPYLSRLTETTQTTPTKIDFLFTTMHAHVVHAFLQLLVPVSLIQAMERGEVEWLGDGEARRFRGIYGDRAGSAICFKNFTSPAEGEVHWDWVMGCLGCAVLANVDTERRLAKEREEMVEVRREWDAEVTAEVTI